MPNPFNIQEVTLAQLADSTHAINTVDPTGDITASPRKWEYQPVVVRVTDHEDDVGSGSEGWPDNTGTPEDEANMVEKCAIFMSRRHGEQWEKQYGHRKHIIAKGSNGTGANVAPVFTGTTLTGFTVNAAGTGYAPKEFLQLSGGTFTERGWGVVGTVDENGAILTVEIYRQGSYTTAATATNIGLIPDDVTNLYADFDYSTFE